MANNTCTRFFGWTDILLVNALPAVSVPVLMAVDEYVNRTYQAYPIMFVKFLLIPIIFSVLFTLGVGFIFIEYWRLTKYGKKRMPIFLSLGGCVISSLPFIPKIWINFFYGKNTMPHIFQVMLLAAWLISLIYAVVLQAKNRNKIE